ncbi:MAG TPA: class I SAM-dependent methyltransferase [Firmicutes bacterium]|nr:class I SAM-dependent methyltransferase [Bacillota bacterium]
MLDIKTILQYTAKPAPFAPAGQPIWLDAHVSRQLLAAHLDPHRDAASRRPETIDHSVAWIIATLGLRPGMAVLDLGCGPGLYCQRLAGAGLKVTGVDFSAVSLAYARKKAAGEGLSIDYRLQDYLGFADSDEVAGRGANACSGSYAAALLIYGDYCVLSPADRKRLLKTVRSSLTDGGRFVLDVTTSECRKRKSEAKRWYAAGPGFWSDKPHIVLEQEFCYPDELVCCDQYIVVDQDGQVRVFRNWFQDFTPEAISRELEEGGFRLLGLYSDLLGTPYQADSGWIGIVAERI